MKKKWFIVLIVTAFLSFSGSSPLPEFFLVGDSISGYYKPYLAKYLAGYVMLESKKDDSQVEDYAKTYSNMKPQEAASIFDTMTDNLGLVADILMNMGTQQRADILGKMDATTAAKLTEIMEPSKKK